MIMYKAKTFQAMLVTVAAAFVSLANPAHALTIYADQNAAWQYINATSGTTSAVPGNWYDLGFNDSGWFTGSAPFTSNPSNPA